MSIAPYLIPVVNLVVFGLLAYFNLARLWAVLMIIGQAAMQTALAAVLYFVVPGGQEYPQSPYWYVPALIALAAFGLAIAAAVNKGRQELSGPKAPGLMGWLCLAGGILAVYTGLVACLMAIYVPDNIAAPSSMQAGVIWFLACAAVGAYLFYQFSSGSRLTTWLVYGLLYLASPGMLGLVLSLIFIYSTPDKMVHHGLTVQCSLSGLYLALLIWGVNRKRVVG
jgi:hypothetical protein